MTESSASTLSALLSLLERARRSAGQADQAELDASAAANRGRSELELLGDALRANPARSRELRTSVQLLREALERAKLSALNAGLEGARIGEPVGKALVDLSQDLRDQLNRAVATLEEHSAMLQDLERERERLTEAVENARAALFASHEAQTRAQPLQARSRQGAPRHRERRDPAAGLRPGDRPAALPRRRNKQNHCANRCSASGRAAQRGRRVSSWKASTQQPKARNRSRERERSRRAPGR